MLVYTQLSSKLVERGNVFKSLILNNEELEVSILMLTPKAKIRKHKHTDESEYYIYMGYNGIQTTYCERGGEHDLENDSSDYLKVLSIKIK